MAGPSFKKLLFIGWDAADWQMIRPLLDAGYMPNLRGLMDRGVWGNLATILPILSPMLWNSIATGKRADKHGILGFVEPKPDATGIRPAASTSRKCKAVWNILSQNDLPSIVVNWFASHPAEPIKGAIVTNQYEAAAERFDRSKASISSSTFHPAGIQEFLEELLVTGDMLDAESLLPFIPLAAEIDQEKDKRLAKLAGLIAKNSSVHAAASHLIQDQPWNFMGIYYSGIDQFGHHFMPYHPPRLPDVSERDVEVYGKVMEGCYRFHDLMLGSLLKRCNLSETTVMLISDHGFHNDDSRPSANGYDDPVGWHRPYGIVCVAGPNIQRGERLYGATLLDVTPTILSGFGLPIGRDMDGRPWAEIFVDPQPPTYIPSWDEVSGDAGLHDPSLREDTAESVEMINQLVELGYVEAPSDDAQETVSRTLREQKVNLALALASSRRAEKAIPIWQELVSELSIMEAKEGKGDLAKKPKTGSQTILFQLAQTYYSVGDFDASEETLNRLNENYRSSPPIMLLDSRVKMAKGKFEEAIKILYEVQKLIPGDPQLLEAFGSAHLQLGNLHDAQWAYESLLEQDIDNPYAICGLSRIALANENYDWAIELSLRTVGLAHNFPLAHLSLGEALAATGQKAEAILALRTALMLSPELEAAQRLLRELIAP